MAKRVTLDDIPDDLFNEIADHQHLLGQAVAMEGLETELKLRAGAEFAGGRDEIAKHTREIAREVEDKAKGYRAEIDKRWPNGFGDTASDRR